MQPVQTARQAAALLCSLPAMHTLGYYHAHPPPPSPLLPAFQRSQARSVADRGRTSCDCNGERGQIGDRVHARQGVWYSINPPSVRNERFRPPVGLGFLPAPILLSSQSLRCAQTPSSLWACSASRPGLRSQSPLATLSLLPLALCRALQRTHLTSTRASPFSSNSAQRTAPK